MGETEKERKGREVSNQLLEDRKYTTKLALLALVGSFFASYLGAVLVLYLQGDAFTLPVIIITAGAGLVFLAAIASLFSKLRKLDFERYRK